MTARLQASSLAGVSTGAYPTMEATSASAQRSAAPKASASTGPYAAS